MFFFYHKQNILMVEHVENARAEKEKMSCGQARPSRVEERVGLMPSSVRAPAVHCSDEEGAADDFRSLLWLGAESQVSCAV